MTDIVRLMVRET